VGWKRGYYYDRRGCYVGTGDLAVLAELLDLEAAELATRERSHARELEQAERQAFQAARQQARQVDSILTSGLTAAGFWRPGRHAWRKKAMATAIETTTVKTATLDLAKMAEFVFTQAVVKDDRTHDKLVAKLRALRADLGGSDPSPALRLAVEAAALCWADHWILELVAAREPLGTSPALDRRRGWAQRRFLQALTTVERVRRLTRPRGPRYAIQINRAAAIDVQNRTLELETGVGLSGVK